MSNLTEKEKLVLYSLVRWPGFNDIELSKKISVKRPTITAIRNKLKANDFYTDVIVPNLEMLGCEILTVRYGTFNPTASYEIRKRYLSEEKFPEVFYKKSTDQQRIAISAFTNFTEAMKYVEYSNIVYSKNDLLSDEGIKHVFFPLKLSKIVMLFDYSPMLRQEFKINLKDERLKVKSEPKEPLRMEFSENEKLILYAIVKYPGLNDGEIAKKVSMTRQSVNKMRKKFEENCLIKRIRVPNLRKLGFEVMMLVHFFIKPKYVMEDRKEGVNHVLSYPGVIFLVQSNLESIAIGADKNFTDLQRNYQKFLSWYKKSDFMAKEPIEVIIPTGEIKESINGRYHPLLKKILMISKEV